MTRSGDPQRTMIFSAEANRIVTRFVAAYRKVGADVIGVIVVAVRNLDRQFGPARILGRTRISATAVRRGGEGRRGAGVGLPVPVGAEREFIGRAGRQAGQSRRLGSRSRRNVYPVIAARRSRLIPEIDVVVGRIFEIERTAQRRLGLGHARRRRSSESGPFGIGVGHVVLPSFEDRPCALNPSGRQAGIGENHVARFGLKPGQRGGNAGAVNRRTRHIGKRADFIVDNGSIGKTHARVFEHALAETSLAAQPDRRAVDLGHRRQEPVRSGLRLFIPAGGEGHGKAQKQKCKNFLHFDINMLFLVF